MTLRGRQSGAGLKPPQAAVVKATVVSVAENRNEIPAGKIERGERKRTVGEVSKAD